MGRQGTIAPRGRHGGGWYPAATMKNHMKSFAQAALRPATRTSDNAGALDIQFGSSTTATMTLPDGRRIPLERQAF